MREGSANCAVDTRRGCDGCDTVQNWKQPGRDSLFTHSYDGKVENHRINEFAFNLFACVCPYCYSHSAAFAAAQPLFNCPNATTLWERSLCDHGPIETQVRCFANGSFGPGCCHDFAASRLVLAAEALSFSLGNCDDIVPD